jgi:hypothetical protein
MTDKPKLSIKEINELLERTRDQKFRKLTQAQIDGRNAMIAVMRTKSFEDINGKEEITHSRQRRRETLSGVSRPKEVMDKILATKKANGVYDDPNHGMRGKNHKEETKIKQAVKAQVRQDLKKKLGLGRSDSVPKDLLQEAYKKAGLT